MDLHIIGKFAGQTYGMMVMKVILSTLIRKFIFKVNEKIEINQIKLKFNTDLSTYQNLKVKIKKRYITKC